MGVLTFNRPQTYTYEGSVSTRARITTDYGAGGGGDPRPDTTNKYYNSRSAHGATENLTSIRIAISNFYLIGAGGNEGGTGASLSATASIEYPSGTFNQVKFSGSANAAVPDGDLLFSDYMSVNIPNGATYWVNEFGHNPAGILYQDWQNTSLGEIFQMSATSIPDLTMSGVTTNSGAFSKPPCAILGMTKNPSFIVLGDSIANGVSTDHDSVDGYYGLIGIIARSFNANTPFLNLSAGSQDAVGWLSNSFARNKLIQKGSHVINNMAVNDLDGGESANSTIIPALRLMFAQCASWQKLYQTTTTPLSSSLSNNFTTLIEQTPRTSQAERAVLIAAIRAKGIAANVNCIDVAALLESGSSDLWIVAPSPPYTGEGIHPSPAGYALVAASGIMNPSVFSWP